MTGAWQPPPIPQSKHRGRLRLFLGREWHILRRYADWARRDVRWAATRRREPQAYALFRHRTPLLRALPDVDMVYQYNKIENLRIAAARLDGISIAPGETFSFWRLVGRPRAYKGYRVGFGLQQGRVVGSIGGGLCQLSNLIFWIALHSPLRVVERWRHSFDVFPDTGRTQPFGSGATCAFNYLDLRLTNDGPDTFHFRFWLDETHLNGELSTDMAPTVRFGICEDGHLIRREPWGAYSRHNRLIKEVRCLSTDALIEQYVVAENHALMMYSPLLEDRAGPPGDRMVNS